MNNVTVYGTNWCVGCRHVKAIMTGLNVKYDYVDIDTSQKGAEKVMKINGGKRLVPTIVIGDEVFSNPDMSTLGKALNRHDLIRRAS